MHGIAGLYATSDHVSKNEFSSFINAAFPKQSEIRSVVWIEHVRDSELEQLYQKAAKDGYADYRLREQYEGKELVDAEPRAVNFVVYHQHSRYQEQWFTQGLNLASLHAYNSILHQSIESKSLVSMRELHSIRQQRGKFIELFLPVYDKMPGSTGTASGQGRLRGFVGMLVNIADSVESVYRRHVTQAGGLDFYVVDIDPRRNEEVLYFHSSRAREQKVEPLPLEQLMQGLHVSTEIKFADTHWRIVFRPIPGFYDAGQLIGPWIVLGSGLIFSLLVAGYLNTIQRRRIFVEQQVQLRTRELDDQAICDEVLLSH